MAKKNLQAAAQSQAQRVLQQGTPASVEVKNDTAFTVWTTPENVRRWKAYQKAKKAVLPTQAAFVEAALLEYMQAHPVTDEEKAALLASLEL